LAENIQMTLVEIACSVFMQVCFFINFSSIKPDTENNANFDAVSSNTPTLMPFSKEDYFDQKSV